MKRLWATLVGVFVLGQVLAGRVEAVDLLGPTHKDLQNQHNDQKNQHTTLQNQHTDQASQHTQLQNQHTDQASQHTNLQNQLNAIQSQLGEVLPPWSRELPAAERFVPVLGGTAVVDRETALVWEQSLDTTDRSWSITQFFCKH